jgi:hypothetical protein
MRPPDPPTRISRPAAQAFSRAAYGWAVVSLVCGVVPILLLFLYQPLIAVALRHLFPANGLGAYIDFLTVPLLLTAGAVGLGLAAVRRSARLPVGGAYFELAVLAFTLSLLDVGLFFVVWVPTVTAVHS